MQELKIKITDDGTPTIYSEQYEATYHSMHGALQESKHVYIKNGLDVAGEKFSTIKILEIGFGTGLNALLSLNAYQKKIYYHALEKYPLPKSIYENLNYGIDRRHLLMLHECPWNREIEFNPNFFFLKEEADILTVELTRTYNLIYFDAFAPTMQKEVWQEPVMRKLYNCMEPGGILVTYSARGEFKRLLSDIGFTVESPRGAAGKREMTRATK
jgi:tRNA U34 5-methylaminomethyl-2-thiouridine-forming methyltransferase MnmC